MNFSTSIWETCCPSRIFKKSTDLGNVFLTFMIGNLVTTGMFTYDEYFKMSTLKTF